MTDRAEAQRRVDQIRAFRAELDALGREGVSLLTPEQSAQLGAHHDRLLVEFERQFDVDRNDAASRLSRGMQVLSFFGAVALTAALFSMVSRFWHNLDVPVQAALLVAFPVAALGGVEIAARRERTLYVASLFALVAYGGFWLAVDALSWTLNIPPTPPVIWAGVFFGLALAIPYRFRIVLAVALTALIVALAASVFQAAGSPWTAAFERHEPIVTAAFLVTLLAPRFGQLDRQFAPVVRMVGLTVGFLGLLILSLAGRQSLMPFASTTAEIFYQVLTLILTIAMLVVSIRRGWRETMYISIGALALFLLSRYVDWFWDVLPQYVFFLVLAAAAFVWLFALRRIRARFHEARA